MNTSLTPVLLRGHLGARFGSEKRYIDVASPAEAIRALCSTVPGFRQYVRESKTPYKIVIRRSETIQADQLHAPSGRNEIRIVPVVRGSGGDGLGQLVVGAALIALAATNPAGMLMIGSWNAAGVVGAIGLSMALGGVSKLLFGAPDQTATTTGSSFLFSGAQNTTPQGSPIPVLYGRLTVPPPLISEGIDTEAFSTTLFSTLFDGSGVWSGNGDTAPWGASLTAV